MVRKSRVLVLPANARRGCGQGVTVPSSLPRHFIAWCGPFLLYFLRRGFLLLFFVLHARRGLFLLFGFLGLCFSESHHVHHLAGSAVVRAPITSMPCDLYKCLAARGIGAFRLAGMDLSHYGKRHVIWVTSIEPRDPLRQSTYIRDPFLVPVVDLRKRRIAPAL